MKKMTANLERLVCPKCDSSDVRPSHLMNEMEKDVSPIFISPYRCQDCGYRFWEIN